AAERVGAEPVGGAGPGQHGGEVHLLRVIGRDDVRGERDDHEYENNGGARRAQGPPPREVLDDTPPSGARLLGGGQLSGVEGNIDGHHSPSEGGRSSSRPYVL